MVSRIKSIDLNINYDKYCDSDKHKCHAEMFPNSIRMIIAGTSGCGKTNLMLNLLLGGVLEYNNIIIYTTTPYQEKYKFLRDCNSKSRKIYKINNDIIQFFSPEDTIMDPSQLDSNKTHLVIFDDVMNEKQKVMTDYFCRGRHNNVNVFYLCQSLHQIPKHGIRQNANIFILFPQDKKTLEYFYNTEITRDMEFEEFQNFCDDAWSKENGYAIINLWEKPESGKYMQNYEEIYIPNKYLKIT